MATQRSKLFGDLLSEGISNVARRQKKTIASVENDIGEQLGFAGHTVQRWKRGFIPTSTEVIAFLVQYCYEKGRVDREWTQTLLNQSDYPDKKSLLQQIHPVRSLVDKETSSILENLPRPEHTRFFGRETELAYLMKLLSPDYGVHLISVDGIGGVGKTALILEAVYRCVNPSWNKSFPGNNMPQFDAVIFTSAKSLRLSSDGILTVNQAQRTLSDIFRVIADVLKLDIIKTSVEQQRDAIWAALNRQQTLLVVDNLEALENREKILSFLYEVPRTVKVVVTTRERVVLHSPLQLGNMLESDAIQLITYEAELKGVKLTDQQVLDVCHSTHGIPGAIVYTIGRISVFHDVDTVIAELNKASGELARYCFQSSVETIRGSDAHWLLMALPMFPKSPIKEALTYAADSQSDGLAQLQKLSLVSQGDKRFRIMPLTYEYAIAELHGYPDFEREARKRWVDWYLSYTKTYGGKDLAEWSAKYNHLEEEWDNLLAVFDWCTSQDLYEEMKAFWLEGRVNTFANLYGYWEDRLTCLTWLTDKAKRYEDWRVAVKSLSSSAWTLTMMGEMERAKELLEEAWALRNLVNADSLHRLANHQAVWYVCQKDFPAAIYWLDIQTALSKEAGLVGSALQYEQILYLFHRASIHYEQTEFDLAEELFCQMIKACEAVKWLRLKASAQNALAGVYLSQNRLDEAESLIKSGLAVAERNKDQRGAALCKKSYAYLEVARGHRLRADEWAAQARDSFMALGMKREIKELDNWLGQVEDP